MKWTEIIIKTTEEASDAISEMFTSIGAGGVVIEDPNDIRRIIESPESLDYADEEFMNSLGDDVTIKAYFHQEYNRDDLIKLVKSRLEFVSQFLDVGKGYIGYTEIDEEDWSTSWKKYYKPFNISEHVVIKPSWEDYKAMPDEIIVELDPGMAFGTGTHETTRLCSQCLEKYVKTGDKVLDVGSGTGILSIIAAKLGAENLVACDVDDIAVRVTLENCIINNVQDKIHVLKGTLNDIKKEKYDIIVANILADIIIGISESIPYYLKKNGYFIASGIIKARKDDVIDACNNAGIVYETIMDLGEWVAIVFKCQNSL